MANCSSSGRRTSVYTTPLASFPGLLPDLSFLVLSLSPACAPVSFIPAPIRSPLIVAYV